VRLCAGTPAQDQAIAICDSLSTTKDRKVAPFSFSRQSRSARAGGVLASPSDDRSDATANSGVTRGVAPSVCCDCCLEQHLPQRTWEPPPATLFSKFNTCGLSTFHDRTDTFSSTSTHQHRKCSPVSSPHLHRHFVPRTTHHAPRTCTSTRTFRTLARRHHDHCRRWTVPPSAYYEQAARAGSSACRIIVTVRPSFRPSR
jgi:hypothetical protein